MQDDFSKRPEIEKRLAAVRAEISALPAPADAALRERLQQLEALCQFHLSATDVAAKAQGERQKATQATAAWRGFPQPPPHSVLLRDEIRDTLASDLRFVIDKAFAEAGIQFHPDVPMRVELSHKTAPLSHKPTEP